MSDLSSIRAAIVATLNTVPGIGRVYDYERYTKSDKDFRDLYLDVDRILGWHVRRVRTIEASEVRGRYYGRHDWRIRGFLSLDDASASELAFDALIEAVRDAFRADESLGGVVDSTIQQDGQGLAGIQVDESGPVMFAGVLCHGCTLSLSTLYTL